MYALHLDVRNGLPYPGRAIREAFYLLARGYSRQHQNGAQAALDPGDNIGIHAITDHHGVLGMGSQRAQGSAHHQWVRFADEIGLDTCGRTDQCGYRTGRRNDSPLTWPHRIWIGGNETRASHHEANGTGNAFKAISRRLTQHHILRLLVGQYETNVMQRRCQSRLPENVGSPTRPLVMQELRGRQRGREDRFRWHIQSHKVQPDLQVAWGVQRVIGKNQEWDPLSPQMLH